MPLYTDIASLSQTPASNAADGTTDAPSTIDNNMNLLASFIARLRDGVNFTVGAITAALGYTPVQQGTGTGQGSNVVKIGWSGATNKLQVQVDSTNFATIWPIDVAGNANTLGSIGPAEFVRRGTTNAMGLTWDSANGWVYPTVDGLPQSSYTVWGKIPDRPTNLSQFSNGPGYITSAYAVQKGGAVQSMQNIGSSGLSVFLSGYGDVAWTVNPSDARLKKGIAPSTEDSLSKIERIEFKQFRFRQDVTSLPVDDGRLHKLGVIAQELEAIDPDWVNNAGTWKAPDQQALLYAALHAVKQLSARVVALEGRA